MNKEIIYIDNIVVLINRKKVKNINMRINKDKTVTISANNKVNFKRLEDFVNSRKDWIISTLEKIDKQKVNIEKFKIKEYINGEKIKIEGVEYVLMVIPNVKNTVEVEDNVIYLYTSDESNFKKKKSLIDKYINKKALELFENSLNEMLEKIKSCGVKKPVMQIRKMKSRWGSCNRLKNKITINFELVKLPKSCLDHVILHELIHFKVSGHNKEFYKYMSILMPDWKDQKKILKGEYLY